jgi:hypothetical protein
MQEVTPRRSEDTGDSAEWAADRAAASASTDRADDAIDAGASVEGSSAVKVEAAGEESAAGASKAAVSGDASMADAGLTDDSADTGAEDAPSSTRLIGGVWLSSLTRKARSSCSRVYSAAALTPALQSERCGMPHLVEGSTASWAHVPLPCSLAAQLKQADTYQGLSFEA